MKQQLSLFRLKKEKKPCSEKNQYTGNLGGFIADIAIKNTRHQLEIWRFKHQHRINSDLNQEEKEILDKYYQKRRNELL